MVRHKGMLILLFMMAIGRLFSFPVLAFSDLQEDGKLYVNQTHQSALFIDPVLADPESELSEDDEIDSQDFEIFTVLFDFSSALQIKLFIVQNREELAPLINIPKYLLFKQFKTFPDLLVA